MNKCRNFSLLLILLSLSCIPFKNYSSADFITKRIDPDSFVFLPVKKINQYENLCVAASTTMLLNYYGMDITQNETAALFDESGDEGLFIKNIVKAVAKKDIDWEYTALKESHNIVDLLKYELNKGKPLIIGLKKAGVYHAAVLCGYDDINFFLIDPESIVDFPCPGLLTVPVNRAEEVFSGGGIHEWAG